MRERERKRKMKKKRRKKHYCLFTVNVFFFFLFWFLIYNFFCADLEWLNLKKVTGPVCGDFFGHIPHIWLVSFFFFFWPRKTGTKRRGFNILLNKVGVFFFIIVNLTELLNRIFIYLFEGLFFLKKNYFSRMAVLQFFLSDLIFFFFFKFIWDFVFLTFHIILYYFLFQSLPQCF